MKELELYKLFIKELDDMWIPELVKKMQIIPINYYHKNVGFITIMGENTSNIYIDGLYVLPEYRRKHLAKDAILNWYREQTGAIRLSIIDKNTVAQRFWNNLFVLQPIEFNSIDTLYEIIKERKI